MKALAIAALLAASAAKVFCPTCVEEGEKSKVYPGMATRTLMYETPGYYNEDGEWVPPVDPNITTKRYSCSRGHKWSKQYRQGKEVKPREVKDKP